MNTQRDASGDASSHVEQTSESRAVDTSPTRPATRPTRPDVLSQTSGNRPCGAGSSGPDHTVRVTPATTRPDNASAIGVLGDWDASRSDPAQPPARDSAATELPPSHPRTRDPATVVDLADARRRALPTPHVYTGQDGEPWEGPDQWRTPRPPHLLRVVVVGFAVLVGLVIYALLPGSAP